MRRSAGFTLVELLVVIGIIALMLSILLPALGKVRESSRQIKCLSNLRQLSLATVQYCNDNNGYYPGRAGQGAERNEQPGVDPANYSGWIAWRREVDAFTGAVHPSPWKQNITHSALARYLGYSKIRPHATPQEAHLVAPKLEEMYRCPSDNVERRVAFAGDLNGNRGLYRYSYSMNIMFGNKEFDPDRPTELVDTNPKGSYRKTSKVRRTSEVIIYLDESELSINNGEFNPLVALRDADDPRKDYSAIAERHESLKTRKNSDDARGNVAFADGHGEFMSRRDALQHKHIAPGRYTK